MEVEKTSKTILKHKKKDGPNCRRESEESGGTDTMSDTPDVDLFQLQMNTLRLDFIFVMKRTKEYFKNVSAWRTRIRIQEVKTAEKF